MKLTRYAYRSFDRHWVLLDSRLADRPRPELQRAHSNRQLYLSTFLANIIGEGSAAIVTALIPDLHHFRGSFGGKEIIPLWQDAHFNTPNLTQGVLEKLEVQFGKPVPPEDFFAYAYVVLFSPRYVQKFWYGISAFRDCR